MTRPLIAALTCAVLMSCSHAPTQQTTASTHEMPTKESTAGLSDGEILYGYRCKGCHEPATPGAPPRVELMGWKPKEVVKALTSGRMKLMATGLSANEMRQIAVFVTGKPMPKKGSLPAITP